MSERNLFSSNEEKAEAEFEKEIHEALPEIPPNSISQKVFSCRRAMNYIIAGFALTAFTFNIFALNYISVTAGYVLLLLGFRTLKHENKWFEFCFAASVIQNVLQVFYMGISSTVYRGAFSESVYGIVFTFTRALIWILMLVLFAQGLKALQKKAGLKRRAVSVAAMIIWYLALYCLSIFQIADAIVFFAFGAVFLVAYIFILRGLYKTSKALYTSGYAIKAFPIKVADKWLALISAAAVAVVVSLGFTFFSSFPMDWTPVSESEHSEVEEIKEQLIDLGFPENVLNDISEEDIKACEGAVGVKVSVDERAVNEGRQVVEEKAGTTTRSTVYDVNECVITNIVVKLPGDGRRLRVFHHFYWRTDPGFRGTEAIGLWLPAKIMRLGCEFSGRVLYENDGVTYISPYYAVKEQMYTSLINRQNMTVFYDFSMPTEGENKRCYVSCEFIQLEDDMNTQANYYHQITLVQFPVYTASEHVVNYGFNDSFFRRVQGMTEITHLDFTDETQPSSDE